MPEKPEPLAYSVADFCRTVSICRATFYNLAKAGKAPPLTRIGKRAVILKTTAEACLCNAKMKNAVKVDGQRRR